MEVLQSDSLLKISVNAHVYTDVMLAKCFYWYSNNYEVDFRKSGNENFEITLKPLRTSEIIDWTTIIPKIKQDLIDFKLRQHITDETKTIRELIIAKAFIYFDDEDAPVSEISDPVGFTPQSIKV